MLLGWVYPTHGTVGARCVAHAFGAFSRRFLPLHANFLLKLWNSLMVTTQKPSSYRRRSRLADARPSPMTCRQPYTAMCAYASLLFLAPLCHAFVTPPTSNMLHFRNDCGAIRNDVVSHKGLGCRSSKRAVPRMMTAASEFGGIQHAGVIVSDTKASKVKYAVRSQTIFRDMYVPY